MSCYCPNKAWAPLSTTDGGRFVFDATKALNPDNPVMLPCGQCVGCRQDRVSSWAIRCQHEAAVHGESCFATLTYSDEALPQDGSVKVRDVQLFMKKLRKRFGRGIRFYAVGEYGEKTSRPHYHLLIFGMDFPDKVYLCKRNGHPVYTSAVLAEIWPHGLSELGDITAKSASYCAQYAQKKITGKKADDHYSRVSPVDGAVYRVASEFATMSRGGRGGLGGLGQEWFNRYGSDVFPADEVIVDGKPRRVPNFYVKLLSETEADRVKRRRSRLGNRYSWDHDGPIHRSAEQAAENRTPERLKVREYIHADRLKRLVRSL